MMPMHGLLSRLAIGLVTLACASAGHAATVTGDLRDITGQPLSIRITFRPELTPLFDGTQTVLDIPRSVWSANGTFTADLVGGWYTAEFGPYGKPIRIAVPQNPGTYTFAYCASLRTNVTTYHLPLTSLAAGWGILAQTNQTLVTVSIDPNVLTAGGQTPWAQDIDAAGHSLLNVGDLEVQGILHGSGAGISNVPVGGISPSGGLDGQVIKRIGGIVTWADDAVGGGGSSEFVAAGQNVAVTTNVTADGTLYTVSLQDELSVFSLTADDFIQTSGDVIASGQLTAQSGSFSGNLSAQGTVSAPRVQATDYVSALNSLRVGTATRLSEGFLDFGNSDSDSFINVGSERLYITNALGIRVDGQIEMPSAVVTNTAFAKDAVLTNVIVLNHLASSNSAWIAGTYIVPRATGNASVDTANIQYALDLATNNGTSAYGGVTEIVLQPGSYVVNTLYVKTHGTRLRGSGVERTRLVPNSSSQPVIDFTGVNGYVTWGGVNNLWWFELADMSIYKSIQPTNQSLSSAVRFRTSTPSSQRLSRAKFSNLRVSGFWKGFDIEHAVGVLFERVEAYGNNYPYWLEKVDSATFLNCFGGDAEDASGVNQFGESYSAVVTYRPNSYAAGFSLLWLGGEARRATVIWDIKGGGVQIIGANVEGIRNGPAILATNSGVVFLTVSGLRATRASGATVPIIRLGPNVASRANVWNLHLTDWSFPHIEYNGANEWMNYAGGHQVIVSNVATARSWYLPASGAVGDGNFLVTSNLLVARTIFATNGVTATAGQFTGDAAGLTNLLLSGLAQSGASVGQVPQWNGSSWVPATVSGGGAGPAAPVSWKTNATPDAGSLGFLVPTTLAQNQPRRMHFVYQLAQNITTVLAPTVPAGAVLVDGDLMIWELIQDGSTPYTITGLAGSYKFGDDIPDLEAPSLGRRTFVSWVYSASDASWRCVGLVRNVQ